MTDAAVSRFARLVELRAGSPPPPASMDRPVRAASGIPLRIAVVASAVLLLAAAAYFALASRPSIEVSAQQLTLSPVTRGLFREYIPLSGNVIPARTVFLDAVEGGQVTRVMAEEGAMVEAGAPLLELKNTDLQLRFVEAEARLTEQVNTLNTRRLQVEQTHLQLQERLIGIDEEIVLQARDLARYQRLLQDASVSAKSVEDMEGSLAALRQVRATILETQRLNRDMQTAQTAQLQSAVDAMSRNLAVARTNLDNLVMRAPIAGQLTIFEAEVGEAKARGQRIGQIDGTSGYKVAAQVDEFYLGRIALGQVARLASEGGTAHELEVAKIYPNVRDRQFQVDLVFHGDPPDLRRGQTLRMNLEIGGESEGLMAANGPWIDDTGGVWAFVVAPDGRAAHRRPIRIGRRNPDRVEIAGGLHEGESLITSSYAQLGEFERVNIRRTP